ncbi:MAG: hypothetical protein IT247_08760 [Bacteroidia bacterium]|nr:hypothetical protein [Bacteroidia bacterium]
MRKITTISFLLLLGIISACKKDFFEPPPPLDLTTPVSFSTDIMPIFEASCYGSGCHDKGIAPDLTPDNAYDQLNMLGYVDTTNAEGSTLYMRMISATNPMPPSGKLSGEKTNKILAWIKQGAKNN